MVKSKLADIIAEKYSIHKTWAQEIIDCVFNEIKAVVREGKEYHHSGFGKFKLNTKAERKMHDIITGKIITLPEKKRIKFTPSRTFNKTLNID